jgi:peptidase E
MGGGGFSDDQRATPIDDFALTLSSIPRPSICFLPTASGDSESYIEGFYAAFSPLNCRPSHLSLFDRTEQALSEILADQDIVYVGGGSTANLLALWRLHGLDVALAHRVSERDLVLCGVSAGALCWFDGGITDSFGPDLRPLNDGLGWAPGSLCPHYDAGTRRRDFHAALVAGSLPSGLGVDDGAAIHLVDGILHEVVAEREGAKVYRVTATDGGVEESAQVSINLC